MKTFSKINNLKLKEIKLNNFKLCKKKLLCFCFLWIIDDMPKNSTRGLGKKPEDIFNEDKQRWGSYLSSTSA